MKIQELFNMWESTAQGDLSLEHYSINLPVDDAARIEALHDMFPRRDLNGILSDLVRAALRDLETSFPYKQGHKVIARDEEGDPLYEDVGPTPRYLALTRKHLNRNRSPISPPDITA